MGWTTGPAGAQLAFSRAQLAVFYAFYRCLCLSSAIFLQEGALLMPLITPLTILAPGGRKSVRYISVSEKRVRSQAETPTKS